MTDRSVTLAVFPDRPYSGWILYFNGIKRSTIIHKSEHSRATVRDYLSNAINHIESSELGSLGLLMVHGRTGSKLNAKGISLPDHLTEIDGGIDNSTVDILKYLFDASNVVRPPKNKKLMLPVPFDEGEGASVSEELAVICSDASIKGSNRQQGKLLAGTGWVIGYYDSGEQVAVGRRSYPRMETADTNTLEMYGVRDALLHLSGMTEVINRASKVILYCDNVMVVRALTVGGSPESVNILAVPVLDAVRELPLDVEFIWVRGHAENRWNLMAHEMAALATSRSRSRD